MQAGLPGGAGQPVERIRSWGLAAGEEASAKTRGGESAKANAEASAKTDACVNNGTEAAVHALSLIHI